MQTALALSIVLLGLSIRFINEGDKQKSIAFSGLAIGLSLAVILFSFGWHLVELLT